MGAFLAIWGSLVTVSCVYLSVYLLLYPVAVREPREKKSDNRYTVLLYRELYLSRLYEPGLGAGLLRTSP